VWKPRTPAAGPLRAPPTPPRESADSRGRPVLSTWGAGCPHFAERRTGGPGCCHRRAASSKNLRQVGRMPATRRGAAARRVPGSPGCPDRRVQHSLAGRAGRSPAGHRTADRDHSRPALGGPRRGGGRPERRVPPRLPGGRPGSGAPHGSLREPTADAARRRPQRDVAGRGHRAAARAPGARTRARRGGHAVHRRPADGSRRPRPGAGRGDGRSTRGLPGASGRADRAAARSPR